MFLLDTDTVIYILKNEPKAVAGLKRHAGEPMGICTATLMELFYGAYKSRRVSANLSKAKRVAESMEVFSVEGACMEVFGMVKAELERAGRRLDDFDLMIAACALANGLTLVTNNVRHFGRVEGLKVVNWMEASG